MSDKYLTAACQRLDLEPERVLRSRVDELQDEYVILADHGIGGIKKYRLPLSELEPVTPEPEPVKPASGRKHKGR